MSARLTYLWLSLAVSVSLVAAGSQTLRAACDGGAIVTETVDLPLAVERLAELHIRHNLKGSVVVKDGLPTMQQIEVRVEKTAATKERLSQITITHALLDARTVGMILLLQLDYIEKPSSLLVLVGGSIGVATVLVLVCVAIGIYHSRSQRLDCPLDNHNAAGGPEDYRDGQDHNSHEHQNTLDGSTCNNGNHGEDKTENAVDDRSSLPVPPPPFATPTNLQNSLPTTKSQSSGRRGKPSGMYRNTVVTFSLVSLIVSVVYGACHRVDTEANVIITIPPQFPLGRLQLFFNKRNRNEVSARWRHQNITRLDVFDVDDASYTDKPPCSAEGTCPDAYTQNLGGCDAAQGDCVCKRGYQLIDGLCIDLDECRQPKSPCHDDSVCHNYIGSYVCLCGPRFYYRNDKCTACTGVCPEGQFESRQCSESLDRTCSVCSKCEGAMYEVSKCLPFKDTMCIHVAHPAPQSIANTVPSYIDVIRSNTSSNAFLERLYDSRDLDTTQFCISNNDQMIDFFWFRDSGIRISIGIEDINILPTYVDVAYDSDNAFMTKNPNTQEEKEHFKKIVSHHCRNPIPDYYSLTMEISRDRSTTAKSITCNSSDPSRPRCPESYADGDTYIQRSLNTACTKMGAFPEKLEAAANSIVCLHETSLLRDIFNQTAPPVRLISFGPKPCRASIVECEQCLASRKCQLLDPSHQVCCKSDCYTSDHCDTASSTDCVSAPVECAMGDAYHYTIEPMFKHLDTQFQCHIRHVSPPTLYKLWFYVTVPGMAFETPRTFRTVHPSDVPDGATSHTVEFITIEHRVGVKLHDDFILIGREDPGLLNRINFTVQRKKSPVQYSNIKPSVRKLSNTAFVSSVQFDEPFAYSTSKWASRNGCKKNVSQITGPQPHSEGASQSVRVVTNNMAEPYTYLISSSDSCPYMKVFVPGNVSILSWFFRDSGPILLTDASLTSNLTLSEDHTAWTIHIEGRTSGCPAYLGLTIDDHSYMKEIMRYDMLVSCPPQFSFTVSFPTAGKVASVHTFRIQISDSRTNYSIFLTHLRVDGKDTTIIVTDSRDVIHVGGVRPASMPIYFIAVVTFVAVFVVAGVAILVCFECTRTKSSGVISANAKSAEKIDCGCCYSRRMSRCQYVVIIAMVMYKIIYAFLFTFTAFSAGLLLCLQNDGAILSRFSDVVANFTTLSINASLKIEAFTDRDRHRQESMAETMHAASEHYLDGLMITTVMQLEQATSRDRWHATFDSKSSVRNVVSSQVTHLLYLYSQEIANFSGKYFEHINRTTKPAFRKYRDVLSSVYLDDWLTFPQGLFNGSEAQTEAMEWVTEEELIAASVEERFAKFLTITQVEDVLLWKENFKNRYEHTLPAMPTPSVSWADVIHCGNTPVMDAWVTRPVARRDSLRYVFTSPPTDYTFDSIEQSASFSQTNNDVDPTHETVNIGRLLLDSTDIQVIQLVAIILDVLLIWHRLTRLFVTARMLCANVEQTVLMPPSDEHVKSNSAVNEAEMQQKLLPFTADDSDIATEESPSAGELDNRKNDSLKPKLNGHSCAHHEKSQDIDRTMATESNAARPVKLIAASFVHSNVVSVFVVTSVLLLSVYCVMTVVTEVLVSCDVGRLLPHIGGSEAHRSSAQSFVEYTARQHTRLLGVWYRRTVHAVLVEMQSFTDYFSSEHTNLTGCLHSEPCVQVTHARSIPPLSSNFIPIQPQQIADDDNLREGLSRTLHPVLIDASDALATSALLLLCTVALIVVLHVIAAVAFRYIRSHRLFPVSHVYLAMFGAPNTLSQQGEDMGDGRTLFYPGDLSRSAASSLLLRGQGTSVSGESTVGSGTFTETKV